MFDKLVRIKPFASVRELPTGATSGHHAKPRSTPATSQEVHDFAPTLKLSLA